MLPLSDIANVKEIGLCVLQTLEAFLVVRLKDFGSFGSGHVLLELHR